MTKELTQDTIVEGVGSEEYQIGRGPSGLIRVRRVETWGTDINVLSDDLSFPPEKKDELIEAIEGSV